MTGSRRASFALVAAAYAAALAVGAGIFFAFPGLFVLWRLAAADGAATLMIWLASLRIRNASVYDPYWSAAPPVLLAALMLFEKRLDVPQLLLLIALLLWGVRLTANWARGFAGLSAQDWRYTKFEREQPRLWPLISLIGIQLMPTAIVFLAMLPALHTALRPAAVRALTIPALLLAAASIWLESAADAQLRRFRADARNAGQVNARGLWGMSRHPNYLGEILFWWGIYFMALSMAPLPLTALIGPVAVTVLFLFVSIPMMEKRQLSTKPGYRAYRQTAGMLLPRLRRRGDESGSIIG